MLAGLLKPSSGEVTRHGRAGLAATRTSTSTSASCRSARRSTPSSPASTSSGSAPACTACRTSRPPLVRAIEAVEMTDAKDRATGGYSKGMKQRIKIAAAIVHQPSILLLDEPFNGADPRQRLRMMDMLRSMAAERRHDRLLLPHPRGGRAAGRERARHRRGPARRVRRLPRDPPPDDGPAALAAPAVERRPPPRRGADRPAARLRRRDRRRAASRCAPPTCWRSPTLAPRVAREPASRSTSSSPTDESLESVFSYLVQPMIGFIFTPDAASAPQPQEHAAPRSAWRRSLSLAGR